MKTSVRGLTNLILRIPLGSVCEPLALFDASIRQQTAHWLRAFFQQSVHRQALYLASPVLSAEVDRWLQSGCDLLPADLELSMAKYAIRSASRSTPFGLFAGLSLARVDERTAVVFSVDRLSPFTRLDSSALVQLHEQLLTAPQWRHKLRYTVTNSAYYSKGQYRYSEFVEREDGRLVVMSSLIGDDYLDSLIAFAQVYRPFDELSEFMAGVAQVDTAEAANYIDGLIENRFLLSELEPTVTGPPYIERLTSWLNAVDSSDELSKWMAEQPVIIRQLTPVKNLQWADEWLNRHGIISAANQSFWQTNLWYATQVATMARPVVDQIGLQITNVFSALEKTRPVWAEGFAHRFKTRYQDRSIPLLEVLDNESGLGLRSATDYLTAPAPKAENLLSQLVSVPAVPRAVSPVDNLRRRLLERSRRSDATEVEILDADLSATAAGPVGYWSALGTLLGSEPAAIDTNQFDFMLRSVSTNPTALVGRFCQDSEELTDLVRSIHEQESNRFAGSVLAEVVHLAGARSGNVNVRPTLRAYEIPYLTPPSVADEYVINLSDLLVSVNNNLEIGLFSIRLNRPVIPKLTTAHNVAYGDEIYQFLCGVGQQHNASAHWSWKEFATEPFLPRVRYKKLIVARAQWHISADLIDKYDSARSCWDWFRKQYQLSRYLTIQTGDNELAVDIDSPIGDQFILSELKKRKKISLAEWLSGPDQCWIKDAAGQPYCHEALLFFDSPTGLPLAQQIKSPDRPDRLGHGPIRKFPPGSEWLYLKLYCGPQTANELLTGSIGKLLNELSEQGQIQQWFFVRYYDPEFHLRLRVRCTNAAQRGKHIMNLLALCQQLVTNGFIDTVQVDTYDRELERYGEQTMALSEDYFAADTRMVVEFLSQHPDADEETLIQFAVASALALPADFAFSDEECLTFFRSRQRAYHHEFSVTKEIKETLNQQFRGYRAQLKDWQPLFTPADDTSGNSLIKIILHQRTKETRQIIETLTQKMSNADDVTTLSLVGSLLHMSMNRLLTSQLRLYELIIYHLCCRYYESIVARSKE